MPFPRVTRKASEDMKNTTHHILAACSAFMNDAATNACWFQTFPPYGRYPVGGTIEGAAKDAEYILDEASAKMIVRNFRLKQKKDIDWPGILVDREHFSMMPDKASDAMAWATDIRINDDGSIWTKWRFTPEGEKIWTDRVLVNRSPAFAATKDGKDYRPFELMSIGMTNTPHFKELSTLAAARATEVNNNKGEIHMNKLIEALGLAEGASEEDMLAAINALKEKASAAEAKATDAEKAKDEAEGKCRKLECDAFLEKNKAKIADVAACREAYMANPELASKMIGACKTVEQKPQTVIGAARKTPEVQKTGTSFATCREEMNALPPNQRQAFYLAHKADIDAGK